jgi:hypothetical protein
VHRRSPNPNAAMKVTRPVSFVPVSRLTGEHDPGNPMHYILIACLKCAVMCRRVVDVAGCAAVVAGDPERFCDVSITVILPRVR